MHLHLLKSKIHRATVTGASVDYEGSLTISDDLMKLAGILPYEKILCSNMMNGQRFETYAIPGEPGAGAIILNGAAAHLGKAGDKLTIMAYATLTPEEAREWVPKVIVLDESNAVKVKRHHHE